MSSALFNPPQPKHWIYIAIIFSALLIISLLNSCKVKKVDIDKTEIKTDFSKKDSVNDMSNKTEQLKIKTDINKVDSNNTYTEIEVIYFKPDSVTPSNSIYKTITKVRKSLKSTQNSTYDVNSVKDSFANNTKVTIIDSSKVEQRRVSKKTIETKGNKIALFIFIALCFVTILYYRYR
jgi:hypothetical protein